MNTAVFFGSTNGNTSDAAGKIAKLLDAKTFDVGKLKSADELLNYDMLILGTSTWYDGELQDDWESFMSLLKATDLSGKIVALFGLGDQEGYGSDFVSGMRQIYDAALACGAKVIGSWEDVGYSYDNSASVIGGKFIGLALDEDNQSELSDERIATWCAQLKSEMQKAS